MQDAAFHEQLLRSAAVDDLLVGAVIAKVGHHARDGEERLIALEVDITEHEAVRRGVEDIQLAAQIIEGRGSRRVRHHRRVAERRAVVANGHAVHEFRQAVAGFGFVQHAVR